MAAQPAVMQNNLVKLYPFLLRHTWKKTLHTVDTNFTYLRSMSMYSSCPWNQLAKSLSLLNTDLMEEYKTCHARSTRSGMEDSTTHSG